MRIDILFMSLAYVVAKLFAKMFTFIYVGGYLGFRHFGPFSLYDILSQNQVKNQF